MYLDFRALVRRILSAYSGISKYFLTGRPQRRWGSMKKACLSTNGREEMSKKIKK